MNIKKRCAWVNNDPLYINYHDEEWGKPIWDDKIFFEFLILESFQAGLSWYTILKKRESFREAFSCFDVEKVALFDEYKVEELLNNKNIIRHRGKILSAIHNAKLFIEIQKRYGSFSSFIWEYVNDKPIKNNWNSVEDIPTKNTISEQIAKDLKNKGFKFLGPVIIYSFMQATGMINDHTIDCFCR